MTDLRTAPFDAGAAPSLALAPAGDASVVDPAAAIPAHEIHDVITSVNAQLESLRAQIVAARAVAEVADALVQLELLGAVQMDRAIDAAHARASAVLAEARATADDLMLQAHVDRMAGLMSLQVPPRGPALPIRAEPPVPMGAPGPVVGPTQGAPTGWTTLDPAEEADEAERFVAFWGVDRLAGPTESDRRRDERVAIVLGFVGALVLLVLALAWLG